MNTQPSVVFICEKYFLKFYRPLAQRLARSGFKPIWITVDGTDQWDFDYLDPGPIIEALATAPDLTCRPSIADLCTLEQVVFERPDSFKKSYPFTTTVVRTPERARRLAEVWHRATLAFIARFRPRAMFVWNGRYLPYSAVSAACATTGQLMLTSEIGWLPGTIFLDRGPLSTGTTDLFGRGLESITAADAARVDAFLTDYTTQKPTMVSQTLVSPSEVRRRLLGEDGQFLLLYGCQVDWDTNVVIGARRFHSNESAVSFLLECMSAVPGARLVVKTHPLDSEKKEAELRSIIGSRGAVVSDIHPHTLIEAADCVSVRNSTLGFETLCYRKPLLLLEHAKYRHERLTLEARDTAEGAASLLRVSEARCHLPDPATLQQFMLHVLDHYLVPVGYRYFFEPDKLAILCHLQHNQSFRGLEQMLRHTDPPVDVGADHEVLRALEQSEFRRTGRRASFFRRIRTLTEWRS
jgi:hypothetical protein